jgi:hypothetical protein
MLVHPAGAPARDPDEHNPIRLFSLSCAAVLLFIRVGNVHQIQTYLLGVNLQLLYIFGIPAILGTIMCGGLRRTLRGRQAQYWLGFAIWLGLSAPFSFWRMGSISVALDYYRATFIIVFFAGGLALTWRELQKLLWALFWGAVVSLAASKIFLGDATGRFSMEFGSVSNSNDFAAHLLFCLPFLYRTVVSSKPVVLRILCLGGIGFGVYIILGTASRGALIALALLMVCLWIWSSARQRVGIAIAVVVGLFGAAVFVPKTAITRLSTLWGGSEVIETGEERDAEGSANQRRYLLGKSIEYTFQHPVLGVGVRQFPAYEGQHNDLGGGHGAWLGTHNGFTQVSSECGIPALLFFVAALTGSFRVFYRTYREARRRPDCRDIEKTALCLMLSFIGYITAFTFLNLAYMFYQCVFVGLAVTLTTVAKDEFARRSAAGAQASGPASWRPVAGTSLSRVAASMPRGGVL